jgi:kynurenine formamidase
MDLTHSLSEKTPVHPAKTPFSSRIRAYYEQGARFDDIALSSGIGTHMDAPSHFYREGKTIDQIPIAQCCGPACVLHLADRVKGDGDYEISMADIELWEKEHGKIPPKSIVLVHTGWDRYWGKEEFCFQDDTGVCHFPGFSKAAAELLVTRQVNGVGIDTTGIDPGFQSRGLAHLVFLKEEMFLVENLANLGRLPPKGAFVYILPMKIEGAPEAPVRAIAVWN